MVPIELPLRHSVEHPLPADQHDLTPAWLTAVLRHSGAIESAAVIDVSVEAIGTGMLGTNLKLGLQYDRVEKGAPETLVAKLAATRPESRATGAELRLYLREIRFYQEIAPTAAIKVPRALFADVSPDGANFCLLFENLAPARGGDQIAGCGVEDARLAMVAAADLHAARWDDAAIAALPWLSRDFAITRYVGAYRQCAPLMRPRFGALLDAAEVEVMESFAQLIAAYFEMQKGPFTVTHQDFRLDNMLFQARDGEIPVAVLDWQTVLLGPGTTDVSYFIGAGMLPGDRAGHEADLVRRYHEALLERGVAGYAWEQCWFDYRLYAAQGIITAVIGAALTSATPRGDAMFATMISRHARHMIDHDTLSSIC